MKQFSSQHRTGPFDRSASDLHHRMGLLTSNNTVNTTVLDAFCRVQVALFYEDLLDYYGEWERVQTICRSLIERCKQLNLHDTMLNLCIEYDSMRRPLPDAIWWIAGSDLLLQPFLTEFLRWLQVCMESGVKQ